MIEQKKTEVYNRLKKVDDPELPAVSIYDLGMVHDVAIDDGNHVSVTLIPTFAGCPALDIIERDVKNAINEIDWVKGCEVTFSFDIKWSTEDITEKGREQLKKHGVSPPPQNYKPGEEWSVDCPYCGSTYTSIENVFGPTACRSILYCRSCRNPFEAMKPVVSYTAS